MQCGINSMSLFLFLSLLIKSQGISITSPSFILNDISTGFHLALSLKSTISDPSHAILRVECSVGHFSCSGLDYFSLSIFDHPYDSCSLPLREDDKGFSGLMLNSTKAYSMSVSGPLSSLNILLNTIKYIPDPTFEGTDIVTVILSEVSNLEARECDPVMTDAYLPLYLKSSVVLANLSVLFNNQKPRESPIAYYLGDVSSIQVSLHPIYPADACVLVHAAFGRVALSDMEISNGGVNVVGDGFGGAETLRVRSFHKSINLSFWQHSWASAPPTPIDTEFLIDHHIPPLLNMIHFGWFYGSDVCEETISMCGQIVSGNNGSALNGVGLDLTGWAGKGRIISKSMVTDMDGGWCTFVPFAEEFGWLNISAFLVNFDRIENKTFTASSDTFHTIQLFTLKSSPTEGSQTIPDVFNSTEPTECPYTGNPWDSGDCKPNYHVQSEDVIKLHVLPRSPVCVISVNRGPVYSEKGNVTTMAVGFDLTVNQGLSNETVVGATLTVNKQGDLSSELFEVAAKEHVTDANIIGLIWRGLDLESEGWDTSSVSLVGPIKSLREALNSFLIVYNVSQSSSLDLSVNIGDSQCKSNSLYR